MKLLFILLLGLGFSQTELTTRVYELNDFLIDRAWDCAETITISSLTGLDLDYGIISLVDLTTNSATNNFQPVTQIFHTDYSVNNISEMSSGYFYGSDQLLINNASHQTSFKSSEDILCVVGTNSSGSGYPVTANLKYIITAPFPIEDTGYIEDGFEFCVSPGANLLSFPCDNPISVEESLPSGIENFITSIIGQGVATSYNPTLGWVGSLEDFDPGSGYWFKSNSSLCFEYECVEN